MDVRKYGLLDRHRHRWLPPNYIKSRGANRPLVNVTAPRDGGTARRGGAVGGQNDGSTTTASRAGGSGGPGDDTCSSAI